MIEFIDIDYNKEYIELIQAFGFSKDSLGFVRLDDDQLTINLNGFESSIRLTPVFDNFKSNIKHHLYLALKDITGTELPWGMLVGVSPLKLFVSLKDRFGENAISILRDKYLVSESKIKLGYQVLENQKHISTGYKNRYSLYINVPFCPSRCSYCSYPTYKIDDQLEEDYVQALLQEITEVSLVLKDNPASIYIGGGTPSALQISNLQKIVRSLKDRFGCSDEFTVEIGRPDTINKELLLMLDQEGIDRISINPQTTKSTTLDLIGRDHTVEEFLKVYSMAKSMESFEINIDLIAGLPGETLEDFRSSLEKIIDLNPDNISVHNLSIKKGAELERKDQSLDFTVIRDKIMSGSDYTPYYLYRQKNMVDSSENIGYTKKGSECLYNIIMMHDVHSVIGLGAASSTKLLQKGIKRHMNYRSVHQYISQIDRQIDDKLKILRSVF